MSSGDSAEKVVMQTVGVKIVTFAPTEANKTGHEQEMRPCELGSFAWFWTSSSRFADESQLAFRPPDSQSSSREDRMAA